MNYVEHHITEENMVPPLLPLNRLDSSGAFQLTSLAEEPVIPAGLLRPLSVDNVVPLVEQARGSPHHNRPAVV